MPKTRADKLLSQETGESRSEIKKKIKKGWLFVNDQKIIDPGFQIVPETDIIFFDGANIVYKEFVYLMLNKPAGLVSAVTDDRDVTVIDHIKSAIPRKNLFPAGRLDKDTEGLLLITDDGHLAHNILSPKKHIPKQYYLLIDGRLEASSKELLVSGITLEDGYITKPAILEIVSENDKQSELLLTISEGKYHQIKRMIRAAGSEVRYLKRIRMGGLALDPQLKPGEFRELRPDEVRLLQEEEKG